MKIFMFLLTSILLAFAMKHIPLEQGTSQEFHPRKDALPPIEITIDSVVPFRSTMEYANQPAEKISNASIVSVMARKTGFR